MHLINLPQLIAPSLARSEIPLALLTSDSYTVRIQPIEYGVHKVHIRLNDVELPQSPLVFESVATQSPNEKKGIYE